jgi:regulator of sigma E protease
MEFFSSAFYFIIVIGILVFIHEFGHFIAARLSGMRTDVFAFGMGPRLLGWNRINGFSFGKLPQDWQGNGHCDYRICAFPIGGYVKVAGMVDESLDVNYLSTAIEPYEFRSKGFFKKFFVLVAGVLMNLLLAVFIYFGINLFEGKVILKSTTVGYVDKNSLAQKIGILENDKIISIGNNKINTWNEVLEKLALDNLGDSREIVVSRNGEIVKLKADGKQLINAITGKLPLGLNVEKTKIVVNNSDPSKAAGKIGLTAGDTIVMIDDILISSFSELTDILKGKKNQDVKVTWNRNNIELSASGKVDASGKLGFASTVVPLVPKETISFGILEAMELAVKQTYNMGNLFINTVRQIFSGNLAAKDALGGPIMIAKGAKDYASLGFVAFLNFIAMLSVTLAIINILPFPVLDGGHIVFIAIEAVIRRELPLKFKLAVQNVGMVLLLLLMVFIIYNDITKVIR